MTPIVIAVISLIVGGDRGVTWCFVGNGSIAADIGDVTSNSRLRGEVVAINWMLVFHILAVLS